MMYPPKRKNNYTLYKITSVLLPTEHKTYDTEMNWLLLTFISALSGSLARILQKVLLKDTQSDPFAFSFAFQVSVAIIFLLYTLLTGTLELPDMRGLFVNLAAMTILYSVGNICLFTAFKKAEASEVSIVFASSTVWSVIAAMMLLGERIHVLNVLGIACIVLSIIVINYTSSTWTLSKGHALALVGAIFYGVAFTNDAYIVSRYDSLTSYMIIAFAFPAITSLLYRPASVTALRQYLRASMLKNLLLSSFIYAVSAFSIFAAFKMGGKAAIISPIQQTSIMFTVIFGYFLLDEKDKVKQKVAAALLAFIGVLLLIQ